MDNLVALAKLLHRAYHLDDVTDDHPVKRAHDALLAAEAERDALRALLARAHRYVEQDAQMMDALTRHAPLDAESQAAHDVTEYESEKLLPLIAAALAEKETK